MEEGVLTSNEPVKHTNIISEMSNQVLHPLRMRNECTMGMQCRLGRELSDWYIHIQNFGVQLCRKMIKWKSHKEMTWFKKKLYIEELSVKKLHRVHYQIESNELWVVTPIKLCCYKI